MDDITATYRAARTRLFLLDYDGTLVGFQNDPQAASPEAHLLRTLETLANNPHNVVVIVSGRDRDTLQRWLGDLPLTLVAEHGHFLREPGMNWRALTALSHAWKEPARALMDDSAQAVPHTFIEEKSSALVWHYRAAESGAAQTEAAALAKKLQPLAATHGLRVTPGNKVVELRAASADKGSIAQRWLSDSWDFIFAAGDDTTDEDLFAVLPPSAFSYKIGEGTSRAAHQLPTPNALHQLLAAFVGPKAT